MSTHPVDGILGVERQAGDGCELIAPKTIHRRLQHSHQVLEPRSAVRVPDNSEHGCVLSIDAAGVAAGDEGGGTARCSHLGDVQVRVARKVRFPVKVWIVGIGDGGGECRIKNQTGAAEINTTEREGGGVEREAHTHTHIHTYTQTLPLPLPPLTESAHRLVRICQTLP